VRAVVEHNLLYQGPQRLWYGGPMFRHERPQKGRYRQFHQFGVEALGFAGPDVDVEHIVMCARLWRMLGVDGIELELNTLGSAQERSRYRTRLVEYLERRQDVLDADSRRRLSTNPLRVLDSKNPAMSDVIAGAPRLLDDLGQESRAHYEGVKAGLAAAGVGFRENGRLVRGLDYYNRTVFEWTTTRLGAQGTVCAGGRYDALVEQIGGKSAPACGFAMGVERLLELMRAARAVDRPAPDIYVVRQGARAERYAERLAEDLRDAGLAVALHCGGGSFKSQMKKADASGARFAVIVGDDEADREELTLKSLRVAAEQTRVKIPEAVRLVQADSAKR
jgi:histidyl-tRNA synthetase